MKLHIQRILKHHRSELPRKLKSVNTLSHSALRASKTQLQTFLDEMLEFRSEKFVKINFQ